MLLCVTIDTEEDNWGDFNSETYQTSNIQKIPEIQKIFDRYNIIPTYLVSYPVVKDLNGSEILQKILQRKRCEIGMHCHPWNTPPFEEERNACNSMLVNLPENLILNKMKLLHEKIKERFGVTPTSFRAGRWGYGRSVAEALEKLNYRVDSSILAYTDLTPIHGPDFGFMAPKPFRFNSSAIYQPDKDGRLVEIPATVGYLHSNVTRCINIDKTLNHKCFRKLKIRGLLRKLKIFKKVYLSPELNNFKEMIEISRKYINENLGVLNLYFHSTSLRSRLSPFVRSEKDEYNFLKQLDSYFQYSIKAGFKSVGLSHAADLLFGK